MIHDHLRRPTRITSGRLLHRVAALLLNPVDADPTRVEPVTPPPDGGAITPLGP